MEDDILDLPSYDAATKIDPWTLVIPYLNTRDIKAIALVSPGLRIIAQSYLWGNPRQFWPQDEPDRFS
ncbi:hypothetical protein M501DRAFT_994813 [Patellaria atrata CBS 101060]|uniref:F-box domain-containing protein n=1 Tax=Patellaria atrata CBS 101060 TaxID=1346257 RepID=A0A9P4VU26_9PEZI|nr:hypothetical protein M501DRAFT_994813 [Patellaria atrata CBS 101060]